MTEQSNRSNREIISLEDLVLVHGLSLKEACAMTGTPKRGREARRVSILLDRQLAGTLYELGRPCPVITQEDCTHVPHND